MRTFLSGISVLLCGLLLMGAVNAPVMQSQSFYINDHAGILSQENRDNMLQAAEGLYAETGARAVLLTIENLGGQTPEEYAQSVYNAWELGAGGGALLLLLSTEEKRFAVYSNTDITVADTDVSLSDALTSYNALATEGQIDTAVIECFDYIVNSIHNMYLTNGEIITKSGDVSRVPAESSVSSGQSSPTLTDTPITESTQNTETTETVKENYTKAKLGTVFFALAFVIGMFMLSQAAKRSRGGRKNSKNNNIYDYRRIYSPDEPIVVRIDDLDYPSGFGGLGNRKAIYLEDVDDAEDIGIIKRKPYVASDKEASEQGI